MAENDSKECENVLKIDCCYNASYVLAKELQIEISNKYDKIISVATIGVDEELRNHGFTNIDNLENSVSKMTIQGFQ